jgi:hypothetical protein
MSKLNLVIRIANFASHFNCMEFEKWQRKI